MAIVHIPGSASFWQRRGAWWCGLLALGWYLLLPQAALHGTDWRWLVLWLEQPGTVHPQHPGYLVLGRLLWALLGPFGVDGYTALLVLSALGGACGVAGVFAAGQRLAADARLAWAAAGFAAATPVVWHFATAVELHAPFFGIAAWAMAATVAWARGGRAKAAAWAGMLTGLATLVHATGHLLVPALAAAVWLQRWPVERWRTLRAVGWFAGCHAATWGAGFLLIRQLGTLPASVTAFATAAPDDLTAPDQPLAYLARWWRDMQFGAQLPATVRVEYLAALAPGSFLVVAALWQRRLRAFGMLLLLVTAGYVVITVALVHAVTDERGAYLIPLAAPFAVLSLLALPRRAWPLLLAAALACGSLLRGEPGRLPPDLAFGRAAAAMAKRQPTVFFVADLPELDGAFRVDPRLELRLARKEYDDLLVRPELRAAANDPALVVAWLGGVIRADAARRGAALVVTDRAVAWLGERLPAFAAAWPGFVQQAGAERLPADSGIAGVVVR